MYSKVNFYNITRAKKNFNLFFKLNMPMSVFIHLLPFYCCRKDIGFSLLCNEKYGEVVCDDDGDDDDDERWCCCFQVLKRCLL